MEGVVTFSGGRNTYVDNEWVLGSAKEVMDFACKVESFVMPKRVVGASRVKEDHFGRAQ